MRCTRRQGAENDPRRLQAYKEIKLRVAFMPQTAGLRKLMVGKYSLVLRGSLPLSV